MIYSFVRIGTILCRTIIRTIGRTAILKTINFHMGQMLHVSSSRWLAFT
jgi:hypothetical protein